MTDQHTYKVALWPVMIGALSYQAENIIADSPKKAAILAMLMYQEKIKGLVMGCVVAMDTQTVYSFFDAQWLDNELYFSRMDSYPRQSPDDNPVTLRDGGIRP